MAFSAEQTAILTAAITGGSFRSEGEPAMAKCRKLNSKGLLRRDLKDAALWYPTHAAMAWSEVSGNVAQTTDAAIAAPSIHGVPQRLPHHPLAALFPMMEEARLCDLVESVRTFGQELPVILLDGHILDGRNREEACHRLGIDAYTEEFKGKDPLGFVLALNLDRRHLTDAQRAMIAAKIVDWENGLNQTTAGDARVHAREAGRRLSISERAVKAAKRIREHGVAELVEAIQGGRLSLRIGEAISHLQREAQETEMRREEKEILQRSQEIRAKRQRERHAVRLVHMAHVVDRGAPTAGRVETQYPVIYADPPWQFGVRSDVTGREKSAENHYPTMATDEICSLFHMIGEPAKRDAVLFLWATNPMLLDALRVMKAWGFDYVHHWVWDKEVAGTGYWGRDRHELLLIGRRGDVAAPLPGSQPETVYRERKGRHSAKPDWFAEQIERLYPDMPRLELFCRAPRPGWHAWGYEAGRSEREVA